MLKAETWLVARCMRTFCIAAGARSESLLVKPTSACLQGHEVSDFLHKTDPGTVRHIINIGSGLDYIIPRRRPSPHRINNRRCWFGFIKYTFFLNRLGTLAGELFSYLRSHQPKKSWAGLRPGSPDGLQPLDACQR